MRPHFFKDGAAFRRWLERNAAKETELLVGFHRVDSGKASLTWSQSVDEALCFGWIDGVRKRIDAGSYTIRFTPRRAGSTWSAINIAKVKALTAEGRMRPAGIAAYERRRAAKSVTYSYEQRRSLRLAPADVRAFRKNEAAWKFFEAAPPSYRHLIVYWVVSAKKPETRASRLARAIAASAAGRRL